MSQSENEEIHSEPEENPKPRHAGWWSLLILLASSLLSLFALGVVLWLLLVK
jgi:hypothetical protein